MPLPPVQAAFPMRAERQSSLHPNDKQQHHNKDNTKGVGQAGGHIGHGAHEIFQAAR